MTRLARPTLLLAGALAFAACSSSSSGGGGSGGSLAFGQSAYSVTSGSTVSMALRLSGSTDAAGVTVTVASSGSAVAVPITPPCVLSDEAGSTASCLVEVRGLAAGTATLTASAPGVTGASATVSVSQAPVPGTLAFTPESTSVVAGSSQRVLLALVGSSGIPGHSVSIVSTNAAAATATPSSCVLSTAAPSCVVTISGVAAGTATVSASATGYASPSVAVTTTASGNIPGTLAFAGNVQVGVGKSQGATLALVGSSAVSPFTVTLSLQNATASISPTTCTVSTAQPVCYLTVTGVSAGSDRIGAAAAGYAGASMVASVIAAPVPGTLHLSPGSVTVSVGATTKVNLSLAGSSGVSSLPVTLAVAGGASVSPTRCTLSSNSSCGLTVTGVAVGAATLTASATGYANAIDPVTVQPSGQVVYGRLTLSPANQSVASGQGAPITVQLVESANVTALPVTLSASPQGIVTLAPTSCTLSTANDQCTVVATGAAAGTATVSTTATGPTSQGVAAVTVTPSASPALTFSPSPLVLTVNSPTGMSVLLSMSSAPATSVTVNLAPQAGSPVAFSVTPSPCVMSATQNFCVLAINNSDTTGITGHFSFTATPVDSSIPPVTLPVYISTLQPVSRTLTVVNQCPFIVYAGISGGSVYGVTPTQQSDCPPGSTYFNAGSAVAPNYLCAWSNPAPSTAGGYQLAAAGPGGAPAPGGTTYFQIPSTSLTNVPGRTDVWSGGIMARRHCDVNGNCSIGTCNAGATGSQACAVGVGFQPPQTVAEFTLLQGGQDTYDVQVIAGVTVPTTMGPTTVSQDPNTPYLNGVAGAMFTQAGMAYSLNPATWTFSPPSTGIPGSSTYFNYVTGTPPVPPAGDACSDATPCPAGQACGYAMNSIWPWVDYSDPDHPVSKPPTYTRVCGTRIAYLSADAVWKANPDTSTSSNLAPFQFYSVPPPLTTWTGYQFLECAPAPLGSGFTAGMIDANACGCTTWPNIGYSTSTCQATNSSWTGYVLPLITWAKTGCPTCYSYPYDDPISTFSGYAPASTGNASNGMNYTVTFCPGGTQIPVQ